MCSIMSQHTSCVIGPPCLLGLEGCVPKGSHPSYGCMWPKFRISEDWHLLKICTLFLWIIIWNPRS